ncbi:MAG: DUF4159 domain-containing protein [Gemmatimonadota bacterium]
MHRPVRLPVLLAAVGALVLLGTASAQIRQGWGGGWRANPIREGLPERGGHVNRDFTFCRLLYQSDRREAMGHGWNTDYPVSDHNFMTRFEELTNVRVARWDNGEPGYAVVRPTDPELYGCPFLFASDVGTIRLSEVEAVRLRDYLLKGGFLWVDDFWGNAAWRQWERAIGRVLPEHDIVDVGPDHPLLSALYLVHEVPQIPSIQFWRREGRRVETSERGRESAEPHLRAIFHANGRPLVIMTHNTDIADGWEREGEDDQFFNSFSPAAYALGINIAVWSMTH